MDKFFLKSKTILGALLLVAASFDVVLPVSNDEISEILELVQKLVGAGLVIYGRFKATRPLGFGI